MFSEDELLPLSGLQHMSFCNRRWALVHIEGVWHENRFTAEGNLLHEKAHSGDVESRPGVLVRRTLPVHSLRLGLSGQADIVEFQAVKDDDSGISLPDRRGKWQPFPVEYKRSRDKAGSTAYRIQLCAQAMCLEEMLSISVPGGAIYDGIAKRRQVVSFEAQLRELVESLSAAMHHLFRAGETPPPVLKKACNSCSLHESCFPESISTQASIRPYFKKFLIGEVD